MTHISHFQQDKTWIGIQNLKKPDLRSIPLLDKNNTQQLRGFEQGTSMIEVLVAIVILSFALLGIAGLLSATTKFQLGVESRSALPMLVNDTSARLRANIREVPGTIGASATPAYTYTAKWADQQAALATPSALCGIETGAVACTTAELAAYDIWQIRTAARRALPQGGVQIAGNSAAGVMVTFIWFDKNNTETSGSNSATLIQAAACPTAITATNSLLRQTCCPAAADVGSTPGARCVNISVVP